jgi:nucleoside-diphosphate-sugar epimerase
MEKHRRIDKVLVVGPNGNVDKHLIPALCQAGYQVRALQYRSAVELQPGVEVVQGNTLDADSLEHAVDGVDAVCQLIRATGPGATSCQRWFNCCLQGSVNLLKVVKDKPMQRVIMGAADNVFGHTTMRHHGPINENHPKRMADGYYGLFKIAEEQISRQYHLGFGVPVVLARFPLIWMPDFDQKVTGALDRENKTIMQKMDIDGKPLVRHDIYVDDVIQGIGLALADAAAIGEDFNFASPAPYASTQLAAVL